MPMHKNQITHNHATGNDFGILY